MPTAVLSMTLFAALSAPAWQAGTLAVYEGEMAAERAEDNVGAKTYTLTVLVSEVGADSTTFLWTINEKGRGGFPWIARYGLWRVNGEGRTIRGEAPAVLFDHGEGQGEASLELLFVQPPEDLKTGASWTRDRLEYAVAEEGRLLDRQAWRVEVRSPFGPKGEVWLEQPGGMPVALSERLTLGQGKPFSNKVKIKDSQTVSDEQLAKAVAAFDRWTALRNELKIEAHEREVEWTDEQLSMLNEQLPESVAAAAGTPLASIAEQAEEDLKLQTGRSDRVAAMRTRLLNRPAPNFELQTSRGEKVTSQDIAGNVAVLHFWEYRDTPLEEPYGQVGYLDFLHRKYKDAGLKVYGVAVDDRLANPAARSQAIAGVRKLQQFMNLDYPVLLDDGTALNRFGDPRKAGGKLPLFVMIGPDGKVLHYHAGFHEIDRDLGLKELDQAVSKALDK